MSKWSFVLLITLCFVVPATLFADECMEGDCDDGFGTGFAEDNKIYEGEWQNGLPHGQGKLYVSKGVIVEGEWEKGELVQERAAEKEREKEREKDAEVD